MKIHDVLTPSFLLLHRQLGHDCTGCQHAMWQQRLSSDSDFCHAVVANGYLSRQQMQHAAQRYLLGRSRDGGVIFWQMVSTEQKQRKIDLIDFLFDFPSLNPET